VHYERLPGMFKLQESLRNRHVDRCIMGEFALADQRGRAECCLSMLLLQLLSTNHFSPLTSH
jgi:hypothetical protein